MTSPCPFDCIISKGKTGRLQLYGDCRVPWNKECWLNARKDKEKEDESGDKSR